MYFSKNKHLLSRSIMACALIGLFMSGIEGLIRLILRRNASLAPDMLNGRIQLAETVCFIIKLAAIIIVFFIARKQLKFYKSIIDEEDYREMRRLQEEKLGKNLPLLNADSISQLLQIWEVILIGAEIIYYISSIIYRRFTAGLMELSTDGESFVSLYNLTHGFKYLEMMTALLMGFAITSIFLRDKYLKFLALALAGLFLLAFAFFQMFTLSFGGRAVGIVWTSVIFHLTEIIGLLVLSIYLGKRYKGI